MPSLTMFNIHLPLFLTASASSPSPLHLPPCTGRAPSKSRRRGRSNSNNSRLSRNERECIDERDDCSICARGAGRSHVREECNGCWNTEGCGYISLSL